MTGADYDAPAPLTVWIVFMIMLACAPFVVIYLALTSKGAGEDVGWALSTIVVPFCPLFAWGLWENRPWAARNYKSAPPSTTDTTAANA